MGPEKIAKFSAPRGEPQAKFFPRDLIGLTPPRTLTSSGGGNRDMAGSPIEEAMAPAKNRLLENRGELLAKFWSQGSERPKPPTQTYRHREGGREDIVGPQGTATGQIKCQYLANTGEPLTKFCSPRTGGGGHMLPPPQIPVPPRRPPSPPPPAY